MKTQYIPKLILKIKKKRLHISTAGAQVWSLASGQLRSHMMCSMAKKKKKERERERKKQKKKKKEYRRKWDYWRKTTDNVGEDQVKDAGK